MKTFENQNIREISIKDLVLWTENPRDPIDENASDEDVVNRALTDDSNKWDLINFSRAMGDAYDFSELPTVVYKKGKPVVYDGNRRIVLGKIYLGIIIKPVQVLDIEPTKYPYSIPCNVCEENVAIQNILRKHGSNGSWNALEREKFAAKHLPFWDKSPFLIIEECLGAISCNPILNRDFVKKEIFTESNLGKMGYRIADGKLISKHSEEENSKIFNDIAAKIQTKVISTRNNRGKIFDVLDDSTKEIIKANEKNQERVLEPQVQETTPQKTVPNRVTQRIAKKDPCLFGGALSLKAGAVNNLYRDICELYNFWLHKEKKSNPNKKLSCTFPSLIRMSLRLIVETAASESNESIASYVEKFYIKAKSALNKDQKTSLHAASIDGGSKLTSLLQMGAHNYEASSNIDQTLAMSIIIGQMLLLSHNKGDILWNG